MDRRRWHQARRRLAAPEPASLPAPRVSGSCPLSRSRFIPSHAMPPPTRTSSVALGVTGDVVEVEMDLADGPVGMILVGLPDTALREARDRICAAIGIREGNRGTTLAPARPAHTSSTGSSDKPFPGPSPAYVPRQRSRRPRPHASRQRRKSSEPLDNADNKDLMPERGRYSLGTSLAAALRPSPASVAWPVQSAWSGRGFRPCSFG
jgi:hypothetical protein